MQTKIYQMTGNLQSFAAALAALLALATGAAQANTITKSNGTNQASPVSIGDVLGVELVLAGAP